MNLKREITVTYEELVGGVGEEFVQDLQPDQSVRISSSLFYVELNFLAMQCIRYRNQFHFRET